MLKHYCNGVFEGGGVKGIGFAGVLGGMEDAGYEFKNVAGTSAGAIVAALIAAGYTGREIEEELKTVNFKEFRQKRVWERLGIIGKTINIGLHYGVFRADNFEIWLDSLLKKKDKHVFGDIKTGNPDLRYKYKFQAIASDITDRMLLVLPRDLVKFGIDPDSFSIAKAVRMSMSIPLYYEPYRLKDSHGSEHLIADGAILSNYPIWVLDVEGDNPEYPTFGFRFTCDYEDDCEKPRQIKNFIDYTKDIVATMMEYGDKYHISVSSGDFQRSILIPTSIRTKHGVKQIQTTYFDITPEESDALCQNGRRAAQKFLETWNFEDWKRTYRAG